MTNYRAGYEFELATMKHLEAEGYWVTRSAGSHSCVDVIGIKTGQVLLVQNKRDGKVSPKERHELVSLAALLDCAVPVLAYKTPGRSAVLLARLTGPGPRDRVPFLTDEVAS